jgi:adenylate cyclase class 2
MLEVEVKLPLKDADTLRRRLKDLGAFPFPPEDEDDTFFQHPMRDFAKTDEALRLRRTGEAMELTYKGPRQPGKAKTRREYNIPVAADPTPVLKALGLNPGFTLMKRRERHRLGKVTICIDDVEGLGRFVEVEAMGEDRREAEERVEDAIVRLGLGDIPREERSYLAMALAKPD